MRDRCIALAAAFQSARLVTQIARTGKHDLDATASSLSSVYMLDSDCADDVFGGVTGVGLGLATLKDQLQGTHRDVELLRYLIAMSALQNKLRRNKPVVENLRAQLQGCEHQAKMLEVTHPSRIGRLAQIYENTLSTIRPRILVRGRTDFLQQPDNVDLIRALLLAGVRACVAWHRAGGRRWQLILGRTEILSTLDDLS